MKRAGRREGSIFRRQDGRWCGTVHLGYDEAGRRVRKSFYATTRAAVAEKVAAAAADRDRGEPMRTDERQTVAQLLERWLTEEAARNVRPSTLARYRDLCRLHIVPVLGRIRLTKLTQSDVQRLLNAKADSGLSPRTVHHVRAVLRHALNVAMVWGDLRYNPAKLTKPPRIPRTKTRVLSPEEARRLLDAAAGDRLAALYTVALAIGIRQGEALGLRWRDIDLEASTLTIAHALQRVDGKLTWVEPKSETSKRTIQLPNLALVALREHRRRQAEERLWSGSRWVEHGLVFCTADGKPLDGTNVTHRLQAILARAELPRLRFHDLRHGCASLLLAQGVPARVVMELLGHSQIALTLGTYSHLLPSLQREAADQMDAAFAV